MGTLGRPARRPASSTSAEELDVAECLKLLRGVDVGRLAVRVDDGVDIFPVNFVVDHGTLLLRTAGGTKLESIERDSRVAFEADDFDWYEKRAWSVVVKGNATRLTRHDDLRDAFGVDLSSWQAERKPFFIRIEPTLTSGRRFTVAR